MSLSRQFPFFYEEFMQHKKRKTSKNQLTKAKTSEQKTTKTTIFCPEKLLRGGKFFILRFFLFKISS